MIFPSVLVASAALAAALYLYLRKQPTRRKRWRTALAIGVGVGLVRAVLASTGWYVVEHTGGPLQGPAFAAAMLAWPEAVFLGSGHGARAPGEFYLWLSLTLVAGTVIMTSLVAAAVELSRGAAHGR